APAAVPPLPPAGEGRGEGKPETSEAPTPTLPRLADLPAAERNALPPLKITMHVFADDPAQRFVILDGRRHAEGATPVDGVVIREIRRDGLVLSLRGRDVLLPRP
ncbi:MAG TPA: general secretion pathway protein GspB, partial [Arenimonas sp.]